MDSGFEEEVAACDKAFAAERADRGPVNPYIPMHKRWEMDDAAFKREAEFKREQEREKQEILFKRGSMFFVEKREENTLWLTEG